MTAKLITRAEPGTDEWHAARSLGIGGSEIAAVVGLSPYESPFSLWHKKKGNLPGQTTSAAMSWGNILEPVIRDHFTSLHPEFVVTIAGTFAKDWQVANLDGLLHSNEGPFPGNEPCSLLEIKTSRYGDGFGPHGSDQIPLHYRCQIQHYLDVMDLPYAWCAVLIGGSDYREYVIDADPADQAALRDAGAAFWASLQTDDEPPIDASHETYEAVRALHPDIEPDAAVEVDRVLYETYHSACADLEAMKEWKRQRQSELLAAIGNARLATVDGTPVLRRQPGRNGAVSLYPVKESA